MKPIAVKSDLSSKHTARDYIYLSLASAFGLGLSSVAPGSFGALLGVLIHVSIVLLLPSNIQLVSLICVFLCVCAVHWWLTPWAIQYWKDTDPQNFVLDEVAGYMLVPILFPEGYLWQVAFWGFLFFRAFDIVKIPPARQIDRKMHGALGIVLDDLVSACYAVLALYCLMWFGSRFNLDTWLIHKS